MWMLLSLGCGCATIRVTDPPRSATEQFLISVAANRAIEQLSANALRDRKVYIDTTYLYSGVPSNDQSYLLGELRAKLLSNGVRLVPNRTDAQIVLELRSGGMGIDRYEYLLGIPALYLGAATTDTGVPLATPELAVIKSTKQRGFASVAFIAYWNDTGELISSSGPFVGRTLREDFWFFGLGPRTVGNIPPAER
ncbi:MAG TPA: DUF6655 family protein [Tepidisphaeraceae bacterium]|nr:DUF6655 family protein [Tepidisphaeraceae bacterium]